jgi:hypothetical protein
MENSGELYGLCGDHYEHLVSRRNTPSVSLLVSSLHATIYHLAPYSAKIHGFTDDQQDLAEANFKKIGPIPRACINFVRDPIQLRAYETRSQHAIANISCHTLRRSLLDAGNLDLDVASRGIFVIRRKEVEDLERAYIEPISANVEMKLRATTNKLQPLEKIELYHTFVSINSTKVIAGHVFESPGPKLLSR